MYFFEIMGWIGSFLYIFSYFLLAYKIIDNGKLYYLLNKIAAALIIIISFVKNTFQPIVINTIWFYISYMAYHQKDIKISFLNKYLLYFGTTIFLISSFIFLFIEINLSFEILAWFSVFSFSISYFLYSMGNIDEKSFHFYNFLAAISLIPKMILFSNYQVVILETLWAIFALYAYIKNSKNNNYLNLCS